MPFTLEGTTTQAQGTGNGFCTASLVLGIISLPMGCVIVPALLAIILGSIGYRQASQAGSSADKKKAIGGIVCAVVGLAFFFLWCIR